MKTITEAMENAAQYLPRGYIIKIKIEKECYTVELEYPHGVCIDIEGDNICSNIEEAICIALDLGVREYNGRLWLLGARINKSKL